MTISSGWPPSQTEYVMVSQDRDVMSYKEDVYKGVEESINILIPRFYRYVFRYNKSSTN